MNEDELRSELNKATLNWEKWQSVLIREDYKYRGKMREEVVALVNSYKGMVDAYIRILGGGE